MTGIRPTVAGLYHRLTEGIDLSESLQLLLPDCCVEVRTESTSLRNELTFHFVNFVARDRVEPDIVVTAVDTPEPDLGLNFMVARRVRGGARTGEEFVTLRDGRVVRHCRTRMQFLFGGEHHLAIGPCLANDDQVVEFVISRYIQYALQRSHLLASAAAVKAGGRYLAISDVSFAGPSSLAPRLLACGASLVSRNRLLIRRRNGLEMVGMPEAPPLESDRVDLVAPMGGLVLLDGRGDDTPLRIERVDLGARRELLGAFMRPAGLYCWTPPEDSPDLGQQAYLDTLSDCPVFECRGRLDSERWSEACVSLVGCDELAG